jgi:chromosome segregation ATPase
MGPSFSMSIASWVSSAFQALMPTGDGECEGEGEVVFEAPEPEAADMVPAGEGDYEVLDTNAAMLDEATSPSPSHSPSPVGIRAWKAELTQLAIDIEKLGPINMLAVEEYAEESTRLTFLQSQRDDLTKARDDLQSAIKEINKTATDLFTETFDAVRKNFQITFQTLFEGGECDIKLEDPSDPLESPVDISASPRGKRTQRIHLLSGGERALTALALLFAIYLVKPSPFCVLDEVDAPLDEANIGRFIQMLKEFKVNTQFIVITHNPRTMEAADWLYGVTMEEPGISSIVGVKLDDVLDGHSAIDVSTV